MAGTILENLSGRKLSILVVSLLIGQFVCFLIGGLIAPLPASVQTITATTCHDVPGSFNDSSIWVQSRGIGECQSIDFHDNTKNLTDKANQIVFVFQMPLPREGKQLDYSRWQQNLIGILQVGVAYKSANLISEPPHSELTIDARLAYRNKDDSNNVQSWKLYAHSLEKRDLDCSPNESGVYSCSSIPLFELGSLYHDYYLLNIRFPVDSEQQINLNIGYINELYLTVIYQNGGFTKVWVSLKTIFFPFIVGIMWWFWHRVHMLQRSPVFLENMLLCLGLALTMLNTPLEYFTLMFDMPWMLLLGDIKQGIFYAILLSFWLIFAGEHMLIQDNITVRNSLKAYKTHLSAVVTGCISLFIFDMCERGTQLRNPFYTIWVSKFGTNVAMTFIILAIISIGIYFLFLCFMVWKVFCNISLKRSALPTMNVARRLHYEGLIYRFKFLMLATLLCAALTVIGFIMGQMAEGQWKWNDNIQIELTSAFLCGVYGMWNIYILALIILYAPSHKQWKSDATNENILNSEEIEFDNLPTDSNPSEISSLTSFTKKTAFD